MNPNASTPSAPSAPSANAPSFVDRPSSLSSDTPPSADPNRLRILVVEDDADAMATSLEALRALGHWATGVRSAESAITRYMRGAFDLLMLDVGLPGLSGKDLAAKLMAIERIPVIFASGEPEPAQPPAGSVWLRKPYALEDLDRALARACSGPVRDAA
ncbi:MULTISPECIES: response regulator [unclassified Variovorax]|jgi:CheY-like chemotaxis protein|uniref:response regulator n=1 Tax=Variovorax TaxID=34072 RepID=UPI000A4F11F8|nr:MULTISPECIES: response regulator [unclassified Variovorax]MCT8180219.1 response regulator [Variovorax sp. CY25R-8]